MTKIKIGVSACLLGQKVRYDGKDKHVKLSQYFDSKAYKLIPICPEVEMGMSIPRAPIQIINDGDIKLVQVDNHSLDFTVQMENWYIENRAKITQFSGFILKGKSPSCGNQTTPHYYSNGEIIISDGMFVQLLKNHNSSVVIIDEYMLSNESKLSNFLTLLK